ncbi:hypothetical protein EA462_11450 [Natrarchaeobius halalkaliphilus]|uniref:Halobacterial output domain-containing protein n=1 Tax=Natrarchaeobius halalkaliphilus TaxID=1679091 RepID=A0A3N6M7E0_9EURY|nr:hypothetical protein EA462_11450 [Natrarchaeobius halalkaliphilus]
MAIVDLVARMDDVDPLDLDPLYHAIDPDALDSICESSSGPTAFEFLYAGWTITVESTGVAGETEISLIDAPRHADAVEMVDTESST